MVRVRRSAVASVFAVLVAACSQPAGRGGAPLRSRGSAIVGGALDANSAHAAVAFLEVYDAAGELYTFCTATLIAPKVVLTAGHCVSDDYARLVSTPSRYGVYFDTDADGRPDWPKVPCWLTCATYSCACAPTQNVAEVQRAAGYSENWNDAGAVVNDVALVKLAAAAPVAPLPALSAALASQHLRVGSVLEYVGYGDQGHPGVDCCDDWGLPRGCEECAYGTRFHASAPVSAICSTATGCADTPPWTISYEGGAGPCTGDSGGPGLVTIEGRQYVAAVTSYGDPSCLEEGINAKVDHYESFISAALGTAPAPDGASCSAAIPCASGYCVGGICCESACDLPCHACARAAGAPQDGHCLPSDGASCEDGDRCTVGDVCRAGVCSAGARVSCPAAGACQSAGVCDTATGACGYAAAQDGTACDDGDATTASDRCLAGRCAGVAAGGSDPPAAGSETDTPCGCGSTAAGPLASLGAACASVCWRRRRAT